MASQLKNGHRNADIPKHTIELSHHARWHASLKIGLQNVDIARLFDSASDRASVVYLPPHKRVEPRVHNTQVTSPIHQNIQVSSATMLDGMLAQRLDFKMQILHVCSTLHSIDARRPRRSLDQMQRRTDVQYICISKSNL